MFVYGKLCMVRENFGELGDLLQICQSLTHQLLVMPEINISIELEYTKFISPNAI